ncbi:hypothetical protein [Lysinibacillus sp. ZYM-1]|uniref:hypothetical protein n=1 Tax=Lysinibacillus sp. ZYM-1 TaxID=1681184 RepID=UPI000AEA2328|nr:hypothetical protein [Lysinibacillus sp. ZYM-1]
MIKNNESILANETIFLREFTEHDWFDVHQYASQEIVKITVSAILKCLYFNQFFVR